MSSRGSGRNLRRFRSEKGQTILEAAIITPLLLMLTFAIVDFALILYVNLALEHGVSQATRYGITGNVMDGLSREESMKAVMRRSAPTLTIDDSAFEFRHMSGGGWVGGSGGPGDIESLVVNYTHDVIVLRPFFTDGQINLRVVSAMKNESRFE
jgi:hypothetical protein